MESNPEQRETLEMVITTGCCSPCAGKCLIPLFDVKEVG
jgi:hypothetical protein